MRRDPRGVVDHRVHPVAHVDEPAAAAEHSMKKARPVASTIGRSQGSARSSRKAPFRRASVRRSPVDAVMVKTVSSVGSRHQRRQKHLQELEGVRMLRVHEQVMHADRQP